MINPNAAAFPTNASHYGDGEICEWPQQGLSIREEIAARIFASMCGSSAAAKVSVETLVRFVPSNAVKLADALIAELNKPVDASDQPSAS